MQDSKINVKNYINTNINTNGINSITGFMHNKALIDFLDSIIWYNERRNEYIFPEHIENLYTSFQSSLPVGTYGILDFDPGINPAITVLQDDVFIVSSASIWNAAPEWDREKDWILYNKYDKELYIYDHRKDVGSRWTKIGIPYHINHNQLNTLQGGDATLDEFYHMTQEQHDALLNMMIRDIIGVTYRVKEILADTSSTTPITADGQYFLIGTSGQYVLYESSDYSTTPTYTTVTISSGKTYLVLNENDQKIYTYSESLGKWLNLGDFIKFDHENLDNLQGGTTGEHYHLTNAQLTTLLSLYNYYLVNEQYVVKKVLSNTTDTSYINANNQYFLVGSSPEFDLYKSTGYPSSPQYIQMMNSVFDTKSYLLYAQDTKKQYFYNAEVGKYIEAGKFIAFEHNAAQEIQGGALGEYYHLTASQWASVIALQYSQTLYVDSISGSDTTGDGSTSLPYKTLYGALLNSTGVNMTFVLKNGINKYYIDDDFIEELQKRKIISITFSNYSDIAYGAEEVHISSATAAQGCYTATFPGAARVGTYYIVDSGNKYLLKSYEKVYDTSGSKTSVLAIQETGLSGNYQIYEIDKNIEFSASSGKMFSDIHVTFDNIKITRSSSADNIFSYLKNTNVIFKSSYIYNNISNKKAFPLGCNFSDCVYDSGSSNINLTVKNGVYFSSLYLINTILNIMSNTFHGDNLALEGGYIIGNDSNSRLDIHNALLLAKSNIDVSKPLKIYNNGETYLSQDDTSILHFFASKTETVKDIDIIFDQDIIFSDNTLYYFDDIAKNSFPFSSSNNINVIFPKASKLNLFKQEIDFNNIVGSGDSVDINLFNINFINNCELVFNMQQDDGSSNELTTIEKDFVLYDFSTTGPTSHVIGSLSSGVGPNATVSYSKVGNIIVATITCSSGNNLYISGKIKRYGLIDHTLKTIDNILS